MCEAVWCVYMCICVCMCVYMCVYMCVCKCVYVYVCVYVCVCVGRYLSGKVRGFHAHTKQKLFEIDAHTRPIMAMDCWYTSPTPPSLHPLLPLFPAWSGLLLLLLLVPSSF
jgi:hypothetical protein